MGTITATTLTQHSFYSYTTVSTSFPKPAISPHNISKHNALSSASLRFSATTNSPLAHKKELYRAFCSAQSSASANIIPPFNVVITGSTKAKNVDGTVKQLQENFGDDQVAGIACDVSNAEDVTKLADFAKSKFGKIDIWINNAGSNAYSFGPIIESNPEDLKEIVTTNTLGVMLCCKEAIRVMRTQNSGGHIFTMDGAGADGNPTPRFAAYGATKRGLAQFTKSLQAELKMLKCENIVVHNLSVSSSLVLQPGMVTTELLMAGSNTKQAKFFINALAERPEDVATFLVPRVREVVSSTARKSSYIRFLTPPKAYSQIFGRLLFQARKDRYVQEE